jgi:hypothetical protein
MKLLRALSCLFLLMLVISAERQPASMYSSAVVEAEKNQVPLQGRDYVFYTVQPGDTLTIVERKFRIVSTDKLLQLNPDLDSGKLPVNRQIKIPLE